MKCTNCGSEIMSGDSFCSVCGARVQQLEAVPSPQSNYQQQVEAPLPNERMDSPHSRDRNNGPWIIAIAVVVALALVGGALYMGLTHQDEEDLWAQCKESNELVDLKEYIDKYPDGEHSSEARRLYDLLIAEKTQWEQAQTSRDEDNLRSFLRNHPSSKFAAQARDVLDDVVWNNVIDKNSKPAVIAYINEFPTGRHSSEAHAMLDDLQRAELTIEERDNVKKSISQFLGGMESWDLTPMFMACNVEMRDFMGKHKASHSDVQEYMSEYRNSDIDSIKFASLAVDVTKSMTSDRRPQYGASFTVTRRMYRGGKVDPTVSLMQGKASLDCYFRFDEISLDKVSDQ